MVEISTDAKKELILKTARELLAANGFAKTTLDDIAHALGMKKSSLYYYYSNKDSLLEDVIKQEEKHFYSIIENELNRAGTTLNRITNYEKAKFEYIKETVKLHETTTSIILELKTKLIEHIERIRIKEMEILKNVLDESVKKKEIKKCDTQKVAKLILAFSEALRHREFYFASFTVGKPINFTNAIEEIVFAIKLIFDGLAVRQ